MMQPTRQNRITGKARETFAKILNHVLADECALSAVTRDYRWSISGPNLYSLHRLFDEQCRQLDHWLDQLFEWTRAAGIAVGSELEKFGRANESHEPAADQLAPRSMIGDLLARHEEMARKLRVDLGRLEDPLMADIFTRMAEYHETSAWMLRILYNGPNRSVP